MDPELKSMLALLLDKVERIEARLAGLDEAPTKVQASAIKDDIARLEEEQRQIREALDLVRLKEVGRIDGRMDQLTMDLVLRRKLSAA